MFAQDKLDLILRRYEELGEKLAAGADGQTYVTLSRERATLDDASLDAEMRALAEAEVDDARGRLENSGTAGDQTSSSAPTNDRDRSRDEGRQAANLS